MSTRQKTKTEGIIFLIATVGLALLIPFIPLKAPFVLLLIVLYYLAILTFLNPLLGLFLLIVVRPCFDALSNEPALTLNNSSITFTSLLGAISLVFSLFIILKNFSKLKTVPLKIPVTIFLAITFISIFFSSDAGTSLAEWLKILSIFSLYFLSYLLINTETKFKKLAGVIIASTVIPAAFAIYQLFTNTGLTIPFEGIYNRIYGTFAHPNMFAYYLIIPIVLLIFLILKNNKRDAANIFFLTSLAFFIALLTLTYTRGAWLAFLLAIFIIGAIKYRKFLIILFLGAILSYFLINPVNVRINNLLYNKNNSIQWRLSLWKDSFNYAVEKPIIGHGTGTARDLILDKRGYQFGSSDPHNDYLKITLENGFLGLLSYIFLIISLLIALFKRYLHTEEYKIKLIILILFSVAVSLYSLSIADNIIRNTSLQWILWSLLGGAFALTQTKEIKKI